MLTKEDWLAIIEQCANQEALSILEVKQFARKYEACKREVLGGLKLDRSFSLWMFCNAFYPLGQSKFRTHPVAFKDCSLALRPDLIERAMFSLHESLHDMTADEAYQEFETIHPFADGNGRMGDLLWRALTYRDTGQWPTTMPPEYRKIAVVSPERQGA